MRRGSCGPAERPRAPRAAPRLAAAAPRCNTRPDAGRRARPRAPLPRLRARRFAGRAARFDLAQLDALAANLDLRVGAPQEFDLAVGPHPRAVARLIHAAARSAERIGDEALGGQGRGAHVRLRQTRAGQIELARNSDARRLEQRVENVGAIVGQRRPMGSGPWSRSADRVARRVDAGLRGAVHVEQLRVRQRPAQARGEGGTERFAAEHEADERGLRRRGRQDGFEERGHGIRA